MEFNFKLNEQLNNLVIQIDSAEKQTIKEQFAIHQPLLKKIVPFIPAVAGWLLHFALYLPITLLIKIGQMIIMILLW